MILKLPAALLKILKVCLDISILIYLAILMITLLTVGVETNILGFEFKATSFRSPIYVLCLLFLIRLAFTIELKNFFLLIGSILCCLIALEIFLRLWNPPLAKPTIHQIYRASPVFGYELIPGEKGLGVLRNTIIINSAGFRDKEYPKEKESGIYRIMVIGDSFTFGMGVNLEDTYVKGIKKLLQNENINLEVINCGVTGYVMWQNYEVLKRKVLPYKPDLVILGIFLNDIYRSKPPYKNINEWKGSNIFKEKQSNGFKSKIYIRNYIKNLDRIFKFRNRYRRGHNYLNTIEERKKYLIKSSPNWLTIMYGKLEKRKYIEFEDTLNKFVETAKNVHCRVLIAYIPDSVQLHDSEGQEINRFIKLICQKSGIPFVDITPKFEMESNPSSLYLFPLDPHTSPKGHQLIAESIVEKIRETGILENVKISHKLQN